MAGVGSSLTGITLVAYQNYPINNTFNLDVNSVAFKDMLYQPSTGS